MTALETRNVWNEVYEGNPLDELPWHQEEPPEYLIELVEKKVVEGPVLDICCGAGTNSVFLAQKGFEVHGIDIAAKAVEMANQKARKGKVSCSFIAGDAIHLPYLDGRFSFIFDRGCFHHIPVGLRERFVEGVARVLKKGGRYQLNCFSDKDPYFNGLSKGDIKKYFSKHFDIESMRKVEFQEKTGLHRYFYTVLMKRR